MKEKQNVRLKGQLRLYMQWPIVMAVLLIGMNIWIYRLDKKAGGVMSLFLLLYIAMVGVLYLYTKSLVLKDLVQFAAQYGVIQNTLLKELAVPYALLLEDGKTIWMNDQFEKVLGTKPKGDAYISKYIPELNKSIFPHEENDIVHMDVYFKEKEYRAELRKVSVTGFSETERLMELPEEREFFIAVYLQDVTELNSYIRANEEQRLVAGLIYIDNYDEVVNSVEEVRQSLLVALVDRKINQYIAKANGIVKKMETDKYFFAVQKEQFRRFEDDKFSLLEDVKSVNIGNNIPATLSIGLGFGTESYAQSYNYARVAIDLALARGGDQAVIKDGSGITYYGGKHEQTAKNTRVKARVKAEALREFLTVKDKVFVMGHKFADADSLERLWVFIGRHRLLANVRILLLMKYLRLCGRCMRPMRITRITRKICFWFPEALDLVEENDLVVVVDTNRPKMTECEELLKRTKTIVVLDHHRQSSDSIENALLSYIEPYASSTCEMVAEILQYMVDDIKIPNLEASSLYAGIMIDTNNFVNKTGVRTFEAAAFLRRAGADITMVRKLFRDDMESYQAKAEIIKTAEVYHEKFAIARGEDLTIESPTIVGAQAANELLDISEIKASFVLTTYGGRIYISARSIDEVNVQVMMERLNGGGHLNAAGAQIEHTNMEKAVETLKKVIDEMVEEGGI